MDALTILRERDRDRYLAVLLVPEPSRMHLAAFYAVDLELRSIPAKVSEPLVGEMRLQWWRDAIATIMHGAATGNPFADALGPAIAAGNLPLAAFEQMIDAHRQSCYAEIPEDEDDMTTFFGAAFGVPVRLATLLLAGGRDVSTGEAAGHAGVAEGLLWVLENLGAHASAGRILLPADLLQRHGIEPQDLLAGQPSAGLASAVEELAGKVAVRLNALQDCLDPLDRAQLPAFAHLAPARQRLIALQKRQKLLQPVSAVQPLRRQWRIWRFSRSGRL